MGSIEETAEAIVRRHFELGDLELSNAENALIKTIEQALRDERERAARILEKRVAELKGITHPTTHNTWQQADLADLITDIRKGVEP